VTISNNPPPVETMGMHIGDLFDEAKGILDGAGVSNDADAEMVGRLMDMARTAKKDADAQRAVEKKPHDDAGKAVQAVWKPLIEKCDLIVDTCRKALTPFQVAKEAEQRAIAEAARLEALRQQQEAIDARRAAGEDLAAREEAERLAKDADRAQRDAARLDKAKPHVVTEGRAIGLRTAYRAEVADMTAFSRWAWLNRRTEYEAFLTDLAEREGRRGPVSIPGIIIHTERKAA
jgi:hypothetical protein